MPLKFEQGNLFDLQYILLVSNEQPGKVLRRTAGEFDRLFFSFNKGVVQQFGDRSWQLEYGDLVYIPATSAYTDYYSPESEGYTILAVLKTDLGDEPFRISFADSPSMGRSWQRLLNEFERKSTGWYFSCMQILYGILGNIFKKWQNEYIGGAAAKKIVPAVEYLNSHFRDANLSVSAAAEKCELSYSRFRKLFHDLYGTSAKEYLGSLRVENARRLLAESALPVAEIAALSGFRDEYYFSAAFKKKTGESPTAFRNRQTAAGLSRNL